MKSIIRWELGGMLFVVVLGSFLHFMYELSGYWYPVGIFAAVNESVWEHLKLGFWPAVFCSLIEYPFLRDETQNVIMGRIICIVTIPLNIIILFYTYTFILGHNSFIMDITIFILSIIIGGLCSYRIMKSQIAFFRWNLLGIMVIIILAVLFGVFTFSPPHLSLFQDPLTAGYGI